MQASFDVKNTYEIIFETVCIIHIIFTKKNRKFIKNIKKTIEKQQKKVYNIGQYVQLISNITF